MTAVTRRRRIWLGRQFDLSGAMRVAALLALALGAVWSGTAHAQPDACLSNLPAPKPIPPSNRVVQLVNCSSATLLGAANAAGKPGVTPASVFPREKTWVMEPVGSGKNVLTVDIPPEWEATIGKKASGPRFWARTGCRYDIASDRAQCETGGCGGKYDCSAAKLSSSGPVTVSEWTFYEPVQGTTYHKDSPDISAVDGANLNMDIQPVDGSPSNPWNPNDIQWLAEQYPLTKHGEDLRNRCLGSFALRRSDLMQIPTARAKGIYGFAMMGDDGKPDGGDSTIACFSNCGNYEFPTAPKPDCPDSDPTCYRWKAFCLNAPTAYGKKCSTDKDCLYGTGCWNNPGSTLDKTCQGRAFIKKETCPADVCTYPYGYVDPKTRTKFLSTQPPFGHCTDVTSDPNACIGDDTLHEVMPRVYTWPNDPQVYTGDAPLYRVIFSPGGTSVPITPAGPIPVCSKLPQIYGYGDVYGGPGSGTKPCDGPVNQQGAVFAVAHPKPNNWGCDLPPTGAGDEGVICRWKQ